MISKLNYIWEYVNKKRIIDFIMLFVIIGFVYQGWFKAGSIAHIDLFSPSKLWLEDQLHGPFSWFDEHYGFSGGVWTLAEYPVYCAWAVLVKAFNLDIDLARRIVWCYTFLILSIFSIYYLSYTLFKNRITCFMSVLLFNLNNIFMIYLGGGYLMGGIGTSFTALVLALFIKCLREDSLKYSLLAGFVLAINTYYDIKFTVLCSAILFMFFLYDIFFARRENNTIKLRSTKEIFARIKVNTKHFLLLGLVASLLNLFWILPSFFGEGVVWPLGSEQPAYVNVSFSNDWFHAFILSLKGRAEMGHIFIPSLFFITILVYISFFFKPKNYYTIFLLICSLIFAFLSKGAAFPFGFIFYWLFNNVPGFVGFRACEKFLFPQLIFYSVLFGFTINRLFFLNRIPYNLAFFLITILLVLSSVFLPFFGEEPYLMKGHSTLNPMPIPGENQLLYKYVENEPENYRNFIFPDKSCFMMHDWKHPAMYPVLYCQGYYKDFSDYFLVNRAGSKSMFDRDKTGYLGKIFGLFSVDNVIVLPQSEVMWGIASNNSITKVIKTMDEQKGFKKNILGDNKNKYDNITVYQNSNKIPLMYIPSKAILVIGSRNIFFKLAPYIDFSKYGFFFASQLKGKAIDILPYIDTIIFNEKDIDDFILNTIDKKYHKDIWEYAKYATHGLPTEQRGYEDWRREDKLWLRYYRQYFSSYLGEIPEGRGMVQSGSLGAKLSFKWSAEESKEYDVWIRMGSFNDKDKLKEKKIGGISFLIDYSFIHYSSSYSSQYAGLKWKKIGTFFVGKGEHIITIENRMGMNSIDDIVIVPKEILSEHSNNINKLISKKEIIYVDRNKLDFKNSLKIKEKENMEFYWNKINPTNYKIKIKNDRPIFLIFNSNYHPLWKLEKQRSIIANSFSNSFLLDKTGIFDINLEYSSQIYTRVGFILSIIFMIGFVICLIVIFKPIKIVKNIFMYFSYKENLLETDKTDNLQSELSLQAKMFIYKIFIFFYIYIIVSLFYYIPIYRKSLKIIINDVFGIIGNYDKIVMFFKDSFLVMIFVIFFFYLFYLEIVEFKRKKHG